MMRTYAEYHHILTLWEDGYNKSEIAQMTDIPRCTVRDCIHKFENVAGLEQYASENIGLRGKSELLVMLQDPNDTYKLHEAYAYLLGLYLGDGYINLLGRVYKLRIALDAKYPGIIERCAQAMKTLLPNNMITYVNYYSGEDHHHSMVEAICYYKYMTQIFPQHGVGLKSKRSIVLEDWQQRIVDAYPLEFLRGLYHSDGSRSQNVVKGKNYPRYFFSNNSDEIRQMFTNACEKLGLEWKQTNARNVAVSRRRDVEYLDQVLGVKA
jgi:DNA-binding transcriptional regulator WhiA